MLIIQFVSSDMLAMKDSRRACQSLRRGDMGRFPNGRNENLLLRFSERFVPEHDERTSSARWEFHNSRLSHTQAKSQFASGRLLSSRRL